MLLGLLAAVMLAVLLQLNAERSRRSDPFDFAADGTIHLHCWVVVETQAAVASRPILALPAPRRQAAPLIFVGETQMLRQRRAIRPPVRDPMVVRVVGIRTQPRDPIVIPDDILHAVVDAEQISASIWQSPPGVSASRPGASMAATLH